MTPAPATPSRDTHRPPTPEAETTAVSADGSRLHVELHGPTNAPAVVLAHGWTCSTAYWAPVIRALAVDHHVIAYDQRGHGRSPAAPGTYTTDVLADDLCAVLQATLAPGRQAVLAGHSMGGMTLMAAAGRREVAAHAAAALLCSTGADRLIADATVVPLRRAARLRGRIHRALLGSGLPLGPVTPLSRRLLRYGTMGPGTAPDRVDVCARIVHACDRRVRAEWSRVLATLDVRDRLADLTAPTTVLVGTADRLTPPRHARRLVEALPHCTGLVELPGVGHMTAIEAPEAVTSAIRQLVTDHLTTARPATADTARTGHPRPDPRTADTTGAADTTATQDEAKEGTP